MSHRSQLRSLQSSRCYWRSWRGFGNPVADTRTKSYCYGQSALKVSLTRGIAICPGRLDERPPRAPVACQGETFRRVLSPVELSAGTRPRKKQSRGFFFLRRGRPPRVSWRTEIRPYQPNPNRDRRRHCDQNSVVSSARPSAHSWACPIPTFCTRAFHTRQPNHSTFWNMAGDD